MIVGERHRAQHRRRILTSRRGQRQYVVDGIDPTMDSFAVFGEMIISPTGLDVHKMEQPRAIDELIEPTGRQRIAGPDTCGGHALVYAVGTTRGVRMAKRIREPIATYHVAPLPRPSVGKRVAPAVGSGGPHTQIIGSAAPGIRAKLFANGRSQAVRLPKEFRLPGVEVLIRRDGDRVILEAVPDVPRDANGWPVDLWEWLDQFSDDFSDPEPMPAGLLPPEAIPSFDAHASPARTLPSHKRAASPKRRTP